MSGHFRISDHTWLCLTRAKDNAGWAKYGVFATAVGRDYQQGLLYVGKSAGPRVAQLCSSNDQEASIRASEEWMKQIPKKNHSDFWRFVEEIDRERLKIAWTNVCKMDRADGKRPPSRHEWKMVSAPCIDALNEEIIGLKPRVTVFVTKGWWGEDDVWDLLNRLGYKNITSSADSRWTRCAKSSEGRFAIMTRHPLGWLKCERNQVIRQIENWLSGSA
jgi:hypothetical protein